MRAGDPNNEIEPLDPNNEIEPLDPNNEIEPLDPNNDIEPLDTDNEMVTLGAGEDGRPVGVIRAIGSTVKKRGKPEDNQRTWIVAVFTAVYGVGMLGVLTIYAILILKDPSNRDAAMQLNSTITLVVGSVGPLIGFYFGRNTSAS